MNVDTTVDAARTAQLVSDLRGVTHTAEPALEPQEIMALSECSHPPHGEVIQYPKENREPSRVGYDEVPDAVENWDYREEDDE